jgi:hypothetical protein
MVAVCYEGFRENVARRSFDCGFGVSRPFAHGGGRQSKEPNCDDRHFALPATGNTFVPRQINTSSGNLLSVEGSMIDAVVNVAIFATLGLCIVGFGAWAHKRVP